MNLAVNPVCFLFSCSADSCCHWLLLLLPLLLILWPAPPLVTFSLGGLGSGTPVSTNVVSLTATWTASVSNFAPADIAVINPSSLAYTIDVSGSGTSYSVIVTFVAPLATGNITLSIGQASGSIVPASGPPLYPFQIVYRTLCSVDVPVSP